jgi:predicted dehydrogenase
MTRLGFLGCGAIAARHLADAAALPTASIWLLFDPRIEAANSARERFAADARTVRTEDEFFAAADSLDAIVLSSPTQAHHPQARRAMELGLDVLCEKPLAGSVALAEDLEAFAARAGRVLSVAFQRRTEALYRTLRREVAGIGRVRAMNLFVCERWQATIAGTWRDDPTVGFGYFGDAGVHQVDSLIFATGLEPIRVEGVSDRRGSRVEIVTSVRSWWRPIGRTAADPTIPRRTEESATGPAPLQQAPGEVPELGRSGFGLTEFEVPLTAHFVGDAHHWREDLTIHGERADLVLRSDGGGRAELQRGEGNGIETITRLEPAGSPLEDFLAARHEGRPPAATAADGVRIARWTESVLAALRPTHSP